MKQIQKNKKQRKNLQLEYIDVRELLDNLGINYKESGKNVGQGWIGVECPFCGNQSFHMGICLKAPVISCFVCGKKGTILTYLAKKLNSFPKAMEILGNAVPRELRSFEEEERHNAIKVELPKEASNIITPYHASYLKSRGFDYKELTEKYNLQFVGPIGRWANRIIVPVIKNYRLITFTSINIADNANIRYLHLSEEKSVIHIKNWLFGIEHTDGHSCCLVEGIFDMIRIGDGAVCTFGVVLSPEQKRMLSKFSVIKICFDGDEAGRTNADRLANDLSAFAEVKLFDLPDGQDPDQLCQEDINKIKNA